MNIQVKIVRIFPQTEKLKAAANLTIDGCFAVHGIKIIDSAKGLFVAMPSIKNGEKHKGIFQPINKDAREQLIKAVLAAYFEQQGEHELANCEQQEP